MENFLDQSVPYDRSSIEFMSVCKALCRSASGAESNLLVQGWQL
jgi:hypothetical protein